MGWGGEEGDEEEEGGEGGVRSATALRFIGGKELIPAPVYIRGVSMMGDDVDADVQGWAIHSSSR